MKYIIAVLLFALFAFTIAQEIPEDGPVKITSNNVGDIVSVGINAELKIDNQIDQDIISIIVAMLNQQAIITPLEDKQGQVQ